MLGGWVPTRIQWIAIWVFTVAAVFVLLAGLDDSGGALASLFRAFGIAILGALLVWNLSANRKRGPIGALFCVECGNTILARWKFCPGCGIPCGSGK